MLLKALRNGLGQLVIFADWITRPARRQRNSDSQAQIARDCQDLALYQFRACPFCVKVRRHLHRLNLPVELRDAKQAAHGQILLEQGGKVQVPCLRIQEKDHVRWLYESRAIIAYLEERFGAR